MGDPLHFEEEYLPIVAEAFQVEDDAPLSAVISLFLGGQVYQVVDVLFPIQQIIEQFRQLSYFNIHSFSLVLSALISQTQLEN